jgi:uncharacterized protein YjiS (DUF1127 family)
MVHFKYIHFHYAITACNIKDNDKPHYCITKGNVMSDLSYVCSCDVPRSSSRGFLSLVARAVGLQRSRRQLGALEDHMLCDIGVTRHAAQVEAQRPVWDAQDHWIRSTF